MQRTKSLNGLWNNGGKIMIYVLLTDGFEEIEAIEPIDICRRAGLLVTTASISSDLQVLGAHDIPVRADINIKDIILEDMEMLILPGGPGHTSLDKDENVHKIIDYAVENDIYIAAICAAPSILGKKGILSGKKATAFPGFEQFLEGCEVIFDKVVKDGKFITARGAGAAAEFGFTIVSTLLDEDTANQLKETMQY